jgi:Tfp pilus assembly protein PilX
VALGYTHVEIAISKSSKKPGQPCGDVVSFERTAQATTIICCDGIGSGIRANIAATMCVTRLNELLRSGFSLRQTFARVVETMTHSRSPEKSYAVFTLARILTTGQMTILSYDMPAPILIAAGQASVLPQRTTTLETALVGEVNGYLEPGDAILLTSDGVTQAGLGSGWPMGWTIEGVQTYLNECLRDRVDRMSLATFVHDRACEMWRTGGDDVTAVIANCRPGKTLNIFTGPPSAPSEDRPVVQRFMQQEGWKVVCGATTASIVGRSLGVKPTVEQNATSLIAPPKYAIEGIDLVTEGAVTLNQVYNIYDADSSQFEEDSGVTELWSFLQAADRVNILLGVAVNPAVESVSFRQRGILSRNTIVPLLADKLRAAGKLVVIEHV